MPTINNHISYPKTKAIVRHVMTPLGNVVGGDDYLENLSPAGLLTIPLLVGSLHAGKFGNDFQQVALVRFELYSGSVSGSPINTYDATSMQLIPEAYGGNPQVAGKALRETGYVGQFDTTSLPDGQYYVRIKVYEFIRSATGHSVESYTYDLSAGASNILPPSAINSQHFWDYEFYVNNSGTLPENHVAVDPAATGGVVAADAATAQADPFPDMTAARNALKAAPGGAENGRFWIVSGVNVPNSTTNSAVWDDNEHPTVYRPYGGAKAKLVSSAVNQKQHRIRRSLLIDVDLEVQVNIGNILDSILFDGENREHSYIDYSNSVQTGINQSVPMNYRYSFKFHSGEEIINHPQSYRQFSINESATIKVRACTSSSLTVVQHFNVMSCLFSGPVVLNIPDSESVEYAGNAFVHGTVVHSTSASGAFRVQDFQSLDLGICVQNSAFYSPSGASPTFWLKADASTGMARNNVIQNISVDGNRANIGYADNDSIVGDEITNFSLANSNFLFLNVKTDPFLPANGDRYVVNEQHYYLVNGRSLLMVNGANSSTFEHGWQGLYSKRVGSVSYVDSVNGDFTIATPGDELGRNPISVVPFDLFGDARLGSIGVIGAVGA